MDQAMQRLLDKTDNIGLCVAILNESGRLEFVHNMTPANALLLAALLTDQAVIASKTLV